MPVVPKHPNETFVISFDFDGDLNDTETIVLASSSATSVDKAGDPANIVATGTLGLSGSTLLLVLTGGEYEYSPYKISLLAVTDAGNTYEHDIFVTVE